MNYAKEEILSIIRANHKQRIQIEKGLPEEEEITYDLTIRNWIDEFELLEWNDLSNYYSELFKIKFLEGKLRNLLKLIKKKTIGDLCEFLSKEAKKPKLKPIKLFGRDCQEAAIFRHLKKELIKKDKKARDIKPSSKIGDYMNDFAFKIIEEVNLISPKILPKINYQENEFERQDWKPFLGGFVAFIFAWILDNWLLAGIGIGLLISSIWMSKIGCKLKADKLEFDGIDTFRDLIKKVKKKRTRHNHLATLSKKPALC